MTSIPSQFGSANARGGRGATPQDARGSAPPRFGGLGIGESVGIFDRLVNSFGGRFRSPQQIRQQQEAQQQFIGNLLAAGDQTNQTFFDSLNQQRQDSLAGLQQFAQQNPNIGQLGFGQFAGENLNFRQPVLVRSLLGQFQF